MVLAQAFAVALAFAVLATVLLGLLNRRAGAMRIAPAWLGVFFMVFVLVLTGALWSGD